MANTLEGQPASTPENQMIPEVTFDEFRRIDLRVAKVLEASRVPNSARLLKLRLDVAGVEKQCIAGIGAKYDPDQLKDKLIVVVMNMKLPASERAKPLSFLLLPSSSGYSSGYIGLRSRAPNFTAGV